MELGLSNSLLAGDPRLIDHIVGEVKSQGIFDKFRKECIADVDTKPAYQNLRTRVESSVNSFLNKQTWRTDLNKNQLRDTLRKHIHDAPYLEVGVERIVDQVVNPKIFSVFMPQIEDVVYKFLGIERPKTQRNGACDLKDLLPKDLDPVSPESDRNSLKDISLESVDENIDEVINGTEQKPGCSKFDEKLYDLKCNSIKKEVNIIENGQNSQTIVNSPTKTALNSSYKSDETNKTEEEEEDSPDFEPIDIMNLNESNMSNDSHLSGISELTSHRSQSPNFITEFSHDNFDCSNQDSQLSKVSSNSRLSIVTDFGSSNHASTPLPESKDDLKYNRDNFKVIRECDNNKDEVIKIKDNSKINNSSKENSRDIHEFNKDTKIKEESKSKHSKDKYESRNSRDKDRDSRRRHKSDKYSRSKSKDKNEFEFQDSKENTNKYKENKLKEAEKKDEVKDLKDLYKEKIRELREKKELTEKEKLGKDRDFAKINKESKDKKDNTSKEKDDNKKNYKSSSRSSSNHNNKISRAESKDSRDKSSSKRDDRHHSNGKNESKPNTKTKRDSKTDVKPESRSSYNSDRSLKDKKRRDEKKSKSTDDHSSLRKNSNDRRSTDRDGSNGSSSKYSHKSSYGTNNSTSKFGPSTNLTKDANKDHSSSETSDSVHDNLQIIFGASEHSQSLNNCNSLDNIPKRVDPGSTEICLPLKKRPLYNDESVIECQVKKPKLENKIFKKKIEKDIFRIDTDVTSVPDEERVQIIEIPDEEYEQPYPDKEPILSLEETKKIILDTEPVHPVQSKLSEMEQSIRQSLTEMMSDHKLNETEDALTSTKLVPVMDSNTLLETLTDDSTDDSESLIPLANNIIVSKNENINLREIEETIGVDIKENLSREGNNVERTENIHKYSMLSGKNTVKNEENMGIKIQGTEGQINKSNQIKLKVQESKIKQEDNTLKVIINKSESKIEDCKGTAEKIENNTFCKIKTDIVMDTHIVNIDKGIKENIVQICMKQEIKKAYVDVKECLNKNKNKKCYNMYTLDNSSVTNININQNAESIDDNIDEFNEDDKLIIDEEFIKKESNENDDIQAKTNMSINDLKLLEYSKNKNNDETTIQFTECKVDDQIKEFNKTEQYQKKQIDLKNFHKEETIRNDIIVDDNCDKRNKNDNNVANTVQFKGERGQKKIKDRLINELYKSNKDEGNEVIQKFVENNKIIERCINKGTIIEISVKDKIMEKLTEKDEILMQSLQEENVGNSVVKIANNVKKGLETNVKNDKKIIKLIGNNDDNYTAKNDDQMKKLDIFEENEKKIEKGLINTFDRDSSKIYDIKRSKAEESKIDAKIFVAQEIEKEEEADDNNDDKNDASDNYDDNDDDNDYGDDEDYDEDQEEADKEVNDYVQDEFFTGATTSKKRKNNVFRYSRINMLTSPFEEECHYLESDNHRYLTFKKYLEKLEADPNRSLENMIESFGGVVVPAIPMAAPLVPVFSKRKHSTSPLADILITNSNNNNDGSGKETTSEEISENFSNPIKKRKLGRFKKVSSTIVNPVNLQQQQPHQQQQHHHHQQHQLQQHQHQHQQLQPQQIAIINGENFVMPLSPESDVSATSEKNPGNALKDDRSRHRSNQRYSSDDLYKPRPLFSSSSRRNRRFNQA